MIQRLEEHRATLLSELAECDKDLADARGESAGEALVVPASRAINEIPPMRWLVPGLMPSVGLLILASPPFVGKSLACISMAGSISAGRPLFGSFRAPRPTPILYVYLESSKQDFLWTVKKSLESRGISGDNFFVRANHTRSKQFRVGGAALESAIASTGAKFIVLDTMAYASAANTEKNEDLQPKLIEPLVDLAEKYECLIALIHHSQKSVAEVEGVYRLRGGSVLSGAADVIIRMERIKGEPHDSKYRKIIMDKVRGSVSGEVDIEFDFSRRTFWERNQDPREVIWTPERYAKYKETEPWKGEA